MDDIQTLRQLARHQDWGIKIDIEQIYNHVPVSHNLSKYLGFQFKDRIYINATHMNFLSDQMPPIFRRLSLPKQFQRRHPIINTQDTRDIKKLWLEDLIRKINPSSVATDRVFWLESGPKQ
ncbi:MAG: hypothetical protein EZS28_010064 [Streblomastix strix]|uniref:Uncharacterized protein n=1 Tax=Streblomastix strix TaxID=222440 RepID=A0A5J4WI75_9EUKA|nr:MAG: hypothetical protein EZS28_010064 [Streblomastix strix]